MKLNQMLREKREKSQLSLRQLEKVTGISNVVLSQMESGHIKEPAFRKVVKVAVALEISLGQLASCE